MINRNFSEKYIAEILVQSKISATFAPLLENKATQG